MRYDVLVVGGGPAGSATARECASLGLSVVVLDKAEFPRDKPCGGGVNVRAARLLPFSVLPVTERVIFGARITVGRSAGYTRYAPEPLTFLTQRRRLDLFLLEHACLAGARLRERTPVRSVERKPHHVVVRAGNERFEGRVLVAADGANGPTARMARIQIPRHTAIALEGNIVPVPYPAEWRDIFGIDLGSIPGGYGWIFPKGDHLNIGVGGVQGVGPSLRSHLDQLTRFYGFDPADLQGVRGHPLPVQRHGASLVDGNVVLVGDAAGLVDPFTGEGIFSALHSGQVAARHVASYLAGASPDLQGYAREMDSGLVRELDISHQIHDLFHLAPSLWAQVVRRWPRAWRTSCNLLTGDQTYAGLKDRARIVEMGLDLASRLVRAREQQPSSV